MSITADTESGLYASGKSVTLKASRNDADIYYTLDGRMPTTSSTRYTAPITLTKSATLKAIATGSNYETSDVLTKQYQITSLTVKSYWSETEKQTPYFIPTVTFSKSVNRNIGINNVSLKKGSTIITGESLVQDGMLLFVPDRVLDEGSYTLTIPENAVMDDNGEPNLSVQMKLVIGKGIEATPIQVSASISHSIALMSDNTLWAWGSNYDYQLGDGTSTRRLKPIKVMEDVIQTCAGDVFTCAIKSDGSLWKWGNKVKTQQKIIDNATFVASANQVVKKDGTLYNHVTNEAILDNVVEYAVDSHYLAVKKDGSLWVWGQNKYGQLGDGTTTDKSTPFKIMDNVSQVAVGWRHSLAVKTDGSLWAWGENRIGQLGDGTTTDRLKPIKIMDNVIYVEANRFSSFVIKTDSSLWAWGSNTDGLLGDGTTTKRLRPVKIMDDVVKVATGWTHTLAIKADGSLWAWGGNDGGELGDGTTKDKTKPVCIIAASSFSRITDLTLAQVKRQIPLGSKYLILPRISSSNGCFETLEFESSDPQVATVSSRGIIEAKKIGKASITVTADGKYTATCEIEVKESEREVVMPASGYATFYDSQSAYTLPNSLSAQVVTSASNGKLTYKTIADGSSSRIVPRETAVLLISSEKRNGTYKLVASDSKLTYSDKNLLHGSDEATTTTGDGYHYKLCYGQSGTNMKDVFGWYWGAADGNAFQIDGHKAWLVVPKTSSGGTRGYTIEGEATGIDVINTDNEGVYHDLQGRRISKPVKKGIYIRNGKIVINH